MEVTAMVLKRIFFMVTILVFFSFFACSTGPYYGSPGNWGHMMNYGFGGGFMWIIFLVVIGFAIYFLFQTQKTKNPDDSVMETPLDILKKRYAKGEIDKEEFDRKKKDLEL